MGRRWVISLVLATASQLPGTVPAAAAAEPGGLAIAAGSFDLFDARSDSFQASVELRLEPLRYRPPIFRGVASRLVPTVGLAGTRQGSVWVYGALRLELELAPRWTLTPSFGLSVYDAGVGKDLGGPVEFRSAIDIAYRLASGVEVGLSFYHLSNSHLYELNPGAESLLVTWSYGR